MNMTPLPPPETYHCHKDYPGDGVYCRLDEMFLRSTASEKVRTDHGSSKMLQRVVRIV